MSAVIGSRWTPEAVERRDTATGFYECINSRHHTQAERDIQRLLLTLTKEEQRAKAQERKQ